MSNLPPLRSRITIPALTLAIWSAVIVMMVAAALWSSRTFWMALCVAAVLYVVRDFVEWSRNRPLYGILPTLEPEPDDEPRPVWPNTIGGIE